MIDYKYADLFKQNSVDIQLEIISDDGKIHITNTEFHEEEFELTESLCSESELTFGACEAGMIKFTVSNVFLPMKGKWLTVKMTVGSNTANPLQIGRYKVYSDTPTADRSCRDIVAYDAMYDIVNADVAEWYNEILPKKTSTTTLKKFRDSFFKYFGITQESVDLINDSMTIEKTVEVTASGSTSSDTEETSTIGETMSGREVLSCICEINGCSGHMGRDGKFHYVYLEQNIQGLYPANDLYPADDLYPLDPKSTRLGKGLYISADYEDYLVKTIDKLQIREKENDIGVMVGSGSNGYVIEDNFLVYGKGTTELTAIANNIYGKIKGIVYRPFTADCKGNPCLEVGDAVRLPTKYELIETYILKRTLKGIQALRDTYEAEGEEYRTQNVNSVQRSILQLKGKSNVLERTLEKTQSTIEEKEKGLISQITQTASDIRLEVKNTKEGLESSINQTASEIKMTVASSGDVWDTSGYTIAITSYGTPDSVLDSSGGKVYPASKYKGKYYLDQKTGYLYLSDGSSWKKAAALKKVSQVLQASIDVTAEKITSEVSRATGNEEKLSSKITQTAEEIREEVSNTKDGLQSQITQTAESIKSEVSRAKGVEEKMSTKIQQTAESIELLSQKGSDMQASIEINANEITSKVSKKSAISEINQSAEGIKIKAKLLELKGSMEITGGYMRIEADESVYNFIEFKRSDTCVQMGTDGMNSKAPGKCEEAYFQYSNISVMNTSNNTIAQLLPSGYGICSYEWQTYSDKRLKHDIEYLDKQESADFVMSLKPCQFVYDYDRTGAIRHGFIAQDVLEVVDNEWEVCGKQEQDGGEYFTLDKTNLIADLVATVQLQQEEIDELKGKVG